MRLKSLVFAPLLLALSFPAWSGGFQWPFAAPQSQAAKPAVGFPFAGFSRPAATGLPFGGANYGNPFSAWPGANPGMGSFGGASLGNMMSPMMGGAMSFLMPFAGNYMIASMNPTTMTNFMGLMMSPQGSPFGSPFGGGFSMFPSATPALAGFGRPAQPSSPFSFFPGFGR